MSFHMYIIICGWLTFMHLNNSNIKTQYKLYVNITKYTCIIIVAAQYGTTAVVVYKYKYCWPSKNGNGF